MVKVSVIVPVYNVENYLDKCVTSILNQTYSDFELLLVNDGSTDNSGNICEEWAKKDSRIQVIHQENQGLGGARNSGIYAAKGKYLLFVDSDDYIYSQLLEKTLAVAEKEDCDVVMFNAVSVDEKDAQGGLYRFNLPSNCLLQEAYCKQLVAISGACNRLWKRQLFVEHDVQFPLRVWYEDLYVSAMLAPYFQKVYYLDCEPFYFYLQRQGSIMHTPDFERVIRERIAAGEAVQRYFEVNNLGSEYKEELEFMWCLHCFLHPAREMGNYDLPFAVYVKKLRNNLSKYCKNPVKNPYFKTLSKKRQILFRLFWQEQYWAIRCLSKIRKMMKGLRR